jgi:hypothetical protein
MGTRIGYFLSGAKKNEVFFQNCALSLGSGEAQLLPFLFLNMA